MDKKGNKIKFLEYLNEQKLGKIPKTEEDVYGQEVIIDLHNCNMEKFNRKSIKDIDFLISPINCWGTSHINATKNNIPIIAVKENSTCYKNFEYPKDAKVLILDNYLEVAGYLMCLQSGVNPKHVVTHNFQNI